MGANRPPLPLGKSAMTITIYSKPSCVQCAATTRAMDARGITYSVIDVTADTEALAYITSLGYRQVPVVVTGAGHWSGFRPDKIDQLGTL